MQHGGGPAVCAEPGGLGGRQVIAGHAGHSLQKCGISNTPRPPAEGSAGGRRIDFPAGGTAAPLDFSAGPSVEMAIRSSSLSLGLSNWVWQEQEQESACASRPVLCKSSASLSSEMNDLPVGFKSCELCFAWSACASRSVLCNTCASLSSEMKDLLVGVEACELCFAWSACAWRIVLCKNCASLSSEMNDLLVDV